MSRCAQSAGAQAAGSYLSAGLPGAYWWVAGGAAESAEDADIELDEVEQLYTERDLGACE